MKKPLIRPAVLLSPIAFMVVLTGAALLSPQFAQTQSGVITAHVDRPGAAISPTLFGLFFEDINFGADGGLYPERVKNRSFEFPDPMMGWKRLARGEAKGALQIYDVGSRNGRPNAHYLQIKVDSGAGFGVTNEGFRGIGVEKGNEFRHRPTPENRNDWECAMSEAAFMTGLERNADVALMSSYAPLFAHVDAWQWTPNLIWFDFRACVNVQRGSGDCITG